MSFGFAIGDFLLLTQLAWTTVQNARRACGAYDELTREVGNLHIVLQRLEHEVSKPESILNRGDNRREEVATLAQGCERILKTLSTTLEKYNALPEERRRATKLLQRIRFGNGEMLDLGELRLQLATHTNAATLFVNLLILGSQGKVEQQMNNHSDELKLIRQSVNWISASFHASSPEGTVWTVYTDDDKTVWRQFRRQLIKKGFKSSTIKRHKAIIIEYLTELGSRGVFDHMGEEDEISIQDEVPTQDEVPARPEVPSPITQEISMQFIWNPMTIEPPKEQSTTFRQATPADALEHSIEQYTYCLKHWDPREAPIRFVGSVFDMYSLCGWIHESVQSYDRLYLSRLPVGRQPKFIVGQTEELRELLKDFRKNLALICEARLQADRALNQMLKAFVKHSEEVPKLFQKFVDAGEQRMLRARMSRRLGESQETVESKLPRRLSEIEWNGRNVIESVWKAQAIETFGKRGRHDFVRNLSREEQHACNQTYSLLLLVHKLKKLNLEFQQRYWSFCCAKQDPSHESALSQTQQDFDSPSSVSCPVPPSPSSLKASTSSAEGSTTSLQASNIDPIEQELGDRWRDSLIRVMGETPIEITTLEKFLQARGISEADLEGEIVKLILETRALYPEGGQLN